MTILTTNDPSYVLITLTEFPYDIRANTASCIEGNKTENSASSPADGKVVNTSMPANSSGVSGHY